MTHLSHSQPVYRTFSKSPHLLSRLLQGLLCLLTLLSVASIISDFMQLHLLRLMNLGTAVTEEQIIANDARQGLIAGLSLLAFLPTMVIFLMWIHRMCRNCHGFGASGMEFTPGWAVGWYFIPIANLVKPYSAMKEIWQVSSDPAQWPRTPASSLLGFWWGAWVLASVMGNVLTRLSMMDDIQIETITSLSLVSNFCDLGLNILALLVVTAIYEKQKQWVEGNMWPTR